MKILSIPMDAGGDMPPVVATTLGLYERGHEVLVYSERSANRIMQDVELRKITSPREIEFSTRLIGALRDASEVGEEKSGTVLKRTLREYSHDQAEAAERLVLDGFQPDLVVTSLVGAGIARQIAGKAGVPFCVMNSDFYIGPDPPRSLEEDFDERSRPEVEYLAEQMQHADLVLHAVDQIFDYGFDRLPPHNHYVGPLLWEKPAPVPEYLEEPGNPWILVTISSQKQQDAMIARLSLEALSNQSVRIIETIGRGHRRKELGPIPSNAHVEHFAPHSKILSQCELMVSHAGIGSVMKAMWYGVPMLLVPWGRDQPGVAARGEHLGVAKVLPRNKLTKKVLEAAIHEVLDEPRYQHQATLTAQRLRREDPVATACDLIEHLIRQNRQP